MKALGVIGRSVLFVLMWPAVSAAIAESFTTNIIDGFGTNVMGPYAVGESGSFNFLIITNKGALTNTAGMLGKTADARNNTAIVTGPGSYWRNSNGLIIGVTGSVNQVCVRDGAQLLVDGITYLGSNTLSSGNRLEIGGSNTTQSLGVIRIGHAGSDNELFLSQGAKLTSSIVRIGYTADATRNRARLSVAGTFAAISRLVVGESGAENTVEVSGGAEVGSVWPNDGVFLGASNTSWGNRIELSDAGTSLGAGPYLYVGGDGASNSVIVREGARLNAGDVYIGSNSVGNAIIVRDAEVRSWWLIMGRNSNAVANELVIDGGSWTNYEHTFVGFYGGQNRFHLRNGAQYQASLTGVNDDFLVGTAGASNVVHVEGPGTRLSHGGRLGWLIVGGDVFISPSLAPRARYNQLRITGGAVVESGASAIGRRTDNNSALLTDNGTLWRNSDLSVGTLGTANRLTISNAATLLTTNFGVPIDFGISNEVLIHGVGSSLTAKGVLKVGGDGSGNKMYILGGARVISGPAEIGRLGGTNIVVVSGAGSTWSNSSLAIGAGGLRNSLRIADGGRVESRTAVLGMYPPGSSRENAAILLGEGTAWMIESNLVIGGGGLSNYVSVSNGASLTAREILICATNGVGDWLMLDGVGTSVNILSNLIVGARTALRSRIEIANGAQLTDENGMVAWHPSTQDCLALVTGSGSSWNNRSNLYIGGNGFRGSLVISNGGRVSSTTSYVGWSGLTSTNIGCGYTQSFSRVRVIGPRSLWQTRGEVHLGTFGIGNALTVTNGGTVVAGTLLIGSESGVFGQCSPMSDANHLIVAGGCIVITNSAGNAIFDVRHGTLMLRSGFVQTDALILTNGNLCRLDCQGGRLALTRGVIRNGSPMSIGDGLRSGHLHLDNGDVAAADGLCVRQHASLSGEGVIDGQVTNAGTIWLSTGHPRTQPVLYVQGDLQMQSTATMMIDISGAPAGTVLRVGGSTFVDGSLRVRIHEGNIPSRTSVFTVLESDTIAGVFTNAGHGDRLVTANRPGSFRVSYSSTGITLDDFQSTDTDGDGIDDMWAVRYFTHSPLSEVEKQADNDGDGATNRDEFLAGTDPTDSASVFALTIEYDNGIPAVTFPFQDGKLYRIWFSEDLQTWREVTNPTFEYSQAGGCRWTDDGKDTELGARSHFYRLSLE